VQPFVAVKKQLVLHILCVCLCVCVRVRVCVRVCVCVCGFSYPTCKAHVPYYVAICGLFGYTLFFPHLINSTIFGGNIVEHKMHVLILSATF
jgi:hypothetical protein